MIEINGIKYAESAAEMVDSLFNDGEGTLPLLPAETQKKLDYLAAIDGVFKHKIKIL